MCFLLIVKIVPKNLNLKFILLPKYFKKAQDFSLYFRAKKYKSLGKFTAKNIRLWDIMFYYLNYSSNMFSCYQSQVEEGEDY